MCFNTCFGKYSFIFKSWRRKLQRNVYLWAGWVCMFTDGKELTYFGSTLITVVILFTSLLLHLEMQTFFSFKFFPTFPRSKILLIRTFDLVVLHNRLSGKLSTTFWTHVNNPGVGSFVTEITGKSWLLGISIFHVFFNSFFFNRKLLKMFHQLNFHRNRIIVFSLLIPVFGVNCSGPL